VRYSRLRRNDVLALTHGLHVSAELARDDLELRCRLLHRVLPKGSFFSHVTAARIWGIPLPLNPGAPEFFDRLHVTTRHPAQVRRKEFVSHRSTNTCEIGTAKGLPVSRPVRALVECAPYMRVDDLVAFADYMLRWITRDELVRSVEAWGPVRGIARVKEALQYVRPGAESPRESIVRWVVMTGGLPEPVCNQDVFDTDGRLLGRPDMAYPEVKLIIEYEGRQHQADRGTYANDIRRRERFERSGWTFLLVIDRDVFDHDALRERIRKRLRDLGHPAVR
jgi:hypothetical protein